MKSNVCIWSDLLLSDIKTLWNCSTGEQVKKTLAAKLQYDFEKLDSKEKLLLDLHFHTLLFAKERNYDEEQTSALFSIVDRTHKKATETPFGNIEETFAYFKELLSCHSVKRPPFCIYLYPVQEVVAITDYVAKTYFRHFKLYKYAFTSKIVMNVTVKYADAPEEELAAVEEGVNDSSTAELEKDAGDTGVSQETSAEEIEDTPAIKELKEMIGTTLDGEIAKLRLNVEEKLKENEDNILKQMSVGRKNGSSPSTAKGSKASKKGKGK